MKTDALVELLARGAGAAPRAVAVRRLGPAAFAGLLMSALLSVVILQPLPAAAFGFFFPWIKLGYSGALVVAALWLASRAARPVARTAQPYFAVLAVTLFMAGVGVASVFGTVPKDRLGLLMGNDALQCLWLLLAVSLPALALSIWAMQGLAPTQLRMAGFAAGLLAGSVGAFGYSLVCWETSAAFVAIWYTLGIVLIGALGGLLGPRVLRW